VGGFLENFGWILQLKRREKGGEGDHGKSRCGRGAVREAPEKWTGPSKISNGGRRSDLVTWNGNKKEDRKKKLVEVGNAFAGKVTGNRGKAR